MSVITGCWHPKGSAPYHSSHIKEISPLHLENGATLHDASLAYEAWGALDSERKNAVLLLHGFTGNSHAASSAHAGNDEPGWWEGLIGPGLAIDTDRFFVVCPNVLGGCHGSTGPASLDHSGRHFGSRFPDLTIRDLVAAEQCWADRLGIRRWHAVIGVSLGGMRALEWAIDSPERVERLVLVATTPACSVANRAIHTTQINAIKLDPEFAGGDYYSRSRSPALGLAFARLVAKLSYSCEKEWQDLELSHASPDSLSSHLMEEALAFARRFDANSYCLLTNAMNSHDIGRGRGGVKEALQRIDAPTMVISIQSDRLFPPSEQELIARHARKSTLVSIESAKGHDGFLYEVLSLSPLLNAALN